MQFDEYPEDALDETEYTVIVTLCGGVRRFAHEYDFSDSWTHDVVVEDVTWSPCVVTHGVCLDGQGACSPEVSVRSPVISTSRGVRRSADEEHDNYLVWVGYKLDPSELNIGVTNTALQRVR